MCVLYKMTDDNVLEQFINQRQSAGVHVVN